jgi:hypothetical protein
VHLERFVTLRRIAGFRWIQMAALAATLYAAVGELWLWLVYRRNGIESGNEAQRLSGPIMITFGLIWSLTSLRVAMTREPESARRTAYAASAGLVGGVLIHLALRATLWPDLVHGCWVHEALPGGFADLLCYDIVPAAWSVTEFVVTFLGPSALWSAAIAFLFGASVMGIRALFSRLAPRPGT